MLTRVSVQHCLNMAYAFKLSTVCHIYMINLYMIWWKRVFIWACISIFFKKVIQEILQALNSAKYDDSSLILFSGLGNVFCNGVDLMFLLSGEKRVVVRQMVDALRYKTFLYCVVQNKENHISGRIVSSTIFISINGFNPFFKGRGFESTRFAFQIW